MNQEEIHLTDFSRILIGDVPGIFYLEIFIRVVFLFFLLVLCMRLLGRRMPSMMNLHELSALTALAAAIGVPLQVPDRGLLPPLVVAFTVVGIQKLFFIVGFKNKKFEIMVHGDLSLLVENGVMNLPAMLKARITREQLLAQLRSQSIKSMGEVRRLYMEANGEFTLIRQEVPKAGLCVLPESDTFSRELQQAEGVWACRKCGYTEENEVQLKHSCQRCNQKIWNPAVIV